jgi:hypothetical protein
MTRGWESRNDNGSDQYKVIVDKHQFVVNQRAVIVYQSATYQYRLPQHSTIWAQDPPSLGFQRCQSEARGRYDMVPIPISVRL